jgi:hypothetical protein
MSRRGKWPLALLIAVAATLAAPAASTAVTVTLGRPNLINASVLGYFECEGCQSGALMNIAPPTGRQLIVPADGQVASWQVIGTAEGGGSVALFALHPNGDGSFTDAASATATTMVDGSSIPTSFAVRASDALGVIYSRGIDFKKEHVRVAFGSASGAVWGQLGYYYQGRTDTPLEPIGDQELLYNATVDLLPPALTGIAPSAGAAGTAVTIKGQHLAIATGVTFGGIQATSFSGDDEQITAIAPPHAGGPVDVQVTTAGGTTPGLPLDVFVYPSVVAVPPANADHTPPTVSSLSLSPASFRAANIGASVIASRVGTRVSDRLSEPARITFTVQRVLAGRRSGKRCVAPKPSNQGKRRCMRYKSIPGSFARTGTAGANSFTFTGRIGGKALPRGGYRLLAVAKDAAGNSSKPVARAFSIVR